MKTEIIAGKNGDFIVRKTDNNGKVEDETLHSEQALDHKTIGKLVGQAVRTHGALRQGWLSFLGLVLAQERLVNFAGQGDKKTGKTSKEFKAAVRDAETDAVRKLVEEKHLVIPSVKNIVNGKEKPANPEENFQAFMSGLRDDKNYSNAKNTAAKYFAIVGKNCVQDGYIVPVPIMQAQIKELLDPSDRGTHPVAELLRDAQEKFKAITISAADAAASLAILKELLPAMQGVADEYAKMATEVRGNTELKPVPAQAAELIASARNIPVEA